MLDLESTIPDGRTVASAREAVNRTSYSPVGSGTGAELGNKMAASLGLLHECMSHFILSKKIDK